MRSLKVQPLTKDRIRLAYPVIQACIPALSLEAWEGFAQPLALTRSGETPGECGIMVAENELGQICGLFSYRLINDLKRGRIMRAENFIALDLINPAVTGDALIEALEGLAERYGCTAIHSVVRDDDDHGAHTWVERVLDRHGHLKGGLLMCKPTALSDTAGKC